MGPEFHRVVSPRVTASRLLVRLSANAVRPGSPRRGRGRRPAQFRALLQDRLEPHLVVLGQDGGVAGEPTGDLPHRGWGGAAGSGLTR